MKHLERYLEHRLPPLRPSSRTGYGRLSIVAAEYITDAVRPMMSMTLGMTSFFLVWCSWSMETLSCQSCKTRACHCSNVCFQPLQISFKLNWLCKKGSDHIERKELPILTLDITRLSASLGVPATHPRQASSSGSRVMSSILSSKSMALSMASLDSSLARPTARPFSHNPCLKKRGKRSHKRMRRLSFYIHETTTTMTIRVALTLRDIRTKLGEHLEVKQLKPRTQVAAGYQLVLRGFMFAPTTEQLLSG